MRVGVNVIKSKAEPRISVQREQVLPMMLQPGSYESGLGRSEMTRHECYARELILCHRDVEVWIQRGELHIFKIVISDAALRDASDGKNGAAELRNSSNVVDSRVAALVTTLNAERVAGFPTGQLFLDSVEHALAVGLAEGYAVRRPSQRSYRGGLSPAHLRRVTDLVHAKMEEELTLREMAQSVELSISHFSEMFRTSTGQTPHQFVLRQRVERAKEMLCAAETRVLDVAIACGFKTQQHFARVFRRLSGVSPTEYRQEHEESERSDPGGRSLDTSRVL
jgi:AraC family transcriptional regulator